MWTKGLLPGYRPTIGEVEALARVVARQRAVEKFMIDAARVTAEKPAVRIGK